MAYFRVFFDNAKFIISQLAGFIQYGIRHFHFADIMQQTADTTLPYKFGVETHGTAKSDH